ncbi:MAG: glycogen synthase GlgA [Proteobacteria bacterium]|nr:glycogen synthase GlgA [Pseudomonadota bacterium]
MAGKRLKGRVLSVASEAVPLIKTGGLADVAGALPAALTAEGWQVRTLLPAYPGLAGRLAGGKIVWRSDDLFGGPARVLAGKVEEGDFLLIEAPHLYDRPGGPYAGGGRDHPDNPERFAALSWVAAEIARGQGLDGWRADVLHAHDWQAGLAPSYLKMASARVRSVMGIHNIAFQGIVPADRLARLRLRAEDFHQGYLEYWGNISTLKAGLIAADAIVTVSPSYAEEIMRPEFGMGLEGVIAFRGRAVQGILNGVDAAIWDPAADPHILPFSAARPEAKAANRARLLAEFGLDAVTGPLAVIVSRMTHQKGIDLLADATPGFVAAGGGLAVLGSGDPWLEEKMQGLAARHAGKVAVRIGYDEALSHRMFAGADAVLVPSRFEPCGLTQMYGLLYGAIPVVAATGGLNDTVIHASPAALAVGAATGITFHPVDSLALSQALRRLVQLHADREVWAAMQGRGMRSDLGWAAAARAYSRLYDGLLAQ